MLLNICSFKSLIIFTIFLLNFIHNNAQTPYLDTLRNQLHRTTDIKEQIDLQIYLAHYFVDYNIDSTKYYAGNIIRMSKEIHDDSNLVYGYQKYALAYYNSSPDSIAIYLDSLLMVADRSNNYHAKTIYHQFKAIEYELRCEYEQSVKQQLITLERAKVEQDTNAILSVVYNFAMMYRQALNTDKVLSIIEENHKYIYSLADMDYYYIFIFIKGAALIDKGDYQEGIHCIHETLSSANNKLSLKDYLDAYQNLGLAYKMLGNIDSCKYYFDQTLKYSTSEFNSLITPFCYVQLVYYLLENNELNKAEAYLNVGLAYSRANVLPLTQSEILVQLIKLYEIKGEYEKALGYVNDYKQLKDSVQTKGLDYLLEKMLIADELENTQNNLSNLVTQRTNTKSLELLKKITLLPLLMFLFYWFYQALSLYKHCNDNKRLVQKKFWYSVLPEFNITLKFIILNAIIYSFLVGVLGILLFKQNSLDAGISIITSFLLFNLCAKLYLYLKKKQPTYSNLTDLILICTFVLSLSIFIAGSYRFIYFNQTITTYLIFVLLNISILLILITPTLIIRHNLIMNKLMHNLTIAFNLKLSQQKMQFCKIELKKPIKCKPIILDNLSEKVSVNPDDIVFISSDNIYQEIICFENNKITKTMVRNTMSNIVEKLSTFPNFFKCHRSYIINTNFIESLEGSTQKCFFTIKYSNEKIPVSRSAAKDFSFSELSSLK